MKPLFFVLTLMIVTQSSYGQNLITARVIDQKTQEPIDKASVYLENDSLQTMTNYLGYFQLKADSSDVIIIKHEDYQTGKIKVPSEDKFTIEVQKKHKNAVDVLTVFQKGEIDDGYKIGIWEYYDSPKVLALKIDYDTKEILYVKEDTSDFAILHNGDFEMMKVDRCPRYAGSTQEFYEIVSKNVKYPMEALRRQTAGTLQVVFEVDSLGYAENFRVLNDIGNSCGEEVLRAINLVPNSWIPAVVDGKIANARFILPITFQIVKDGRNIGYPKKMKKEPLPVAKLMPELNVKAFGATRGVMD